MKFCSGCKNVNDQTKTGRPKTVDTVAVFQAIDVSSASSTQGVSGEFDISLSIVVQYLHTLGKSIQSC